MTPDGTGHRILEASHRMAADDSSWHRALVRLGDTGHRPEAGHRPRVQVASRCFPLHLPHTARLEHPWWVRRALGSTQRLPTGGAEGARLGLTALLAAHRRDR
ncbi:hypothetical protein GQF42_36785 [Streptomyces broussonetiae]|uniref:Uncharacterized protein n=1 Tax=Streptomyces broussonetiae TaxID=2686304 RepID=A0A6I6NBD4_9ACTN|nr:hypothetical protein [Streptomyces broussonetiae]QHA08089.1 hypothetical protein GQF42_36785 [Streptomyces broussonetiae]